MTFGGEFSAPDAACAVFAKKEVKGLFQFQDRLKFQSSMDLILV